MHIMVETPARPMKSEKRKWMVCETQEQAAYENGENLPNCVDDDSQIEVEAEVFNFELNFRVNKPKAETSYHSFRNPLCPSDNFLRNGFNCIIV